MSNSAALSEAAALIRENAECLRACHATPAGGWSDSDAEVKEHYEYELSLADRLEALAPAVSACAGVPTEILQSWINPPPGQMGLPQGSWHRHLVTLGAENAELLSALEGVLPFVTGNYWPGVEADTAVDVAVAIARKARARRSNNAVGGE